MPAPFNKFNVVVEHIMHGVHNFNTHTIKVALTNTAPTATNTIFGDIVEIAAGNGYPAGGPSLVKISSGQTNGTYKYIVEDLTITASGGAIGPFRYIVLYNSSVQLDQNNTASKPLIGWYDYGQSITLNDGESFTIDSSQTDGIIQLV